MHAPSGVLPRLPCRQPGSGCTGAQVTRADLAAFQADTAAAATARALAAVANAALAHSLAERPTLAGLLGAVRRVRRGEPTGDAGPSWAAVAGPAPGLEAEPEVERPQSWWPGDSLQDVPPAPPAQPRRAQTAGSRLPPSAAQPAW